MKQLLSRIVEYKLNPVNFNRFVITLNETLKTYPEVKKLYYQDGINEWIQNLKVYSHNKPLSVDEHEKIDAILYRIEELIVYEMILNKI